MTVGIPGHVEVLEMNRIRGGSLSRIKQTTNEMKLVEERCVCGKKMLLSFDAQLTKMPARNFLKVSVVKCRLNHEKMSSKGSFKKYGLN